MCQVNTVLYKDGCRCYIDFFVTEKYNLLKTHSFFMRMAFHPDENKCTFKKKVKSLNKWFAEFIRSF